MVSSRNTPLLLLLLDGVADAFVIQQQQQPCHNSQSRCPSSSSQAVVLNSFSYIGGYGGEEGNVEVEEYPASTATFQFQQEQEQYPQQQQQQQQQRRISGIDGDIPVSEEQEQYPQQQQQQQQQQQPFPFASATTEAPSFDFPVPQEELEEEEYQTELYFDTVDIPAPQPDLAYPQYAEPEVIANPYDFTTFREDEEYIDAIPTVAAPIPRSTAGAITLATNPVVSPATEIKNIWETDAPQTIQGASLKTWDFNSEHLEAVQVLLKTEGRPLKADIELWQGENAPQKISVYSENGETRPLSAFVATPYQGHTAIAVKNSGEGEFPMKACVEADLHHNGNYLAGANSPGNGFTNQLAKFTLQNLWEKARPKTVQGDGATYVVPLESNIQRVQILITSEKNPINARIEILEGPNNVKQVMEISTEDGCSRPFFCVLDLPDPILTNVMRVVNTGPFEFPIECRIEPFKVENKIEEVENLYFLVDEGPSAGQTSNSPFLLS
eukprot:CAMPEP_0201277928 /NCGR_PEP_ID=MMETSP0853-20130426/59843_1 /ASSEMBLY_ACC=CAM_ASM_000640 /TAXON_ID=183588 /ORGANISM="Pseudo-nitzschia fraudulenta, Strain WWA7" /LENGTH=496 /DNA_ID=CAMNT_0047586173 /DNA_START=189 /DNA_END=1680 /DNA_ORIENTATION=-